MNEEIFRKKSLDKVKSPDNLDDYIHVSNANIWLLLVSVLILLIGACVWGIYGHIDSTVSTSVKVQNGSAICYVSEADASRVKMGMKVKFDDKEAVITDVERKDENFYYVLELDQSIDNGIYDGKIVTESIKPISFILN